ncbi:RNHCP domain-containing protein [Streptomyces sp. TRM66268-LWL]|uniref:RNHCP domain-containing protein n=1 Tax=Streptomyces polyasparticus TaxID=2767826 RepID=A0ABR7SBT8_9ACTN|nr:RNHCP domain-containing protein [Streptomyces polyasparticus]MBC9712940.1 RNHCP domain-containing protein [Streptomyces polyasparticus]
MSSDHLAHQHHTTGAAFGIGTFTCVRCGLTVSAKSADGTRRNHCPSCLHSRHVLDQIEGGPSECGARMSPIAIAVLRTGDWTLVHRCVRCGELSSDPVCGDDNQLMLMRMAVRPLADPPFPLEAFGSL